jgi:hypothetical protein
MDLDSNEPEVPLYAPLEVYLFWKIKINGRIVVLSGRADYIVWYEEIRDEIDQLSLH